MTRRPPRAGRRRFLGAMAGTVPVLAGAAAGVVAPAARAQMSAAQPLIGNDLASVARNDPLVKEITGGGRVDVGRVRVELPVLADNGNAVRLRVAVDSSMTPAEHVKKLYVLSEKNPERRMGEFAFSPENGRAQIVTRVRLAGSQRVTALAQMSDGSWWIGAANIVVTLSACIDES